MKKFFLIAFLLFFNISCHPIQKPELDLDVRRLKLPNGMTCLLVKRNGAPIFSGYIRIKVGSIEDPDGSSGLAHFFEHMAFKGTPTIGSRDYAKESEILKKLHAVGGEIVVQRKKGKTEKEIKTLREELEKLQIEQQKTIEQNEFVRIYQKNGGADMNANTNTDYTNYFVSLPSNKLELWAYMESERLLNPVYREFYKERDVVAEERRMRYDNDPDGQLYEAFVSLAFNRGPYSIPVVGLADEIQNYTYPVAGAFHDRYYIPSRIVLAVVGNFNLDDAEANLKKYFGHIPAKADQPKTVPEETKGPEFPREKTIPSAEEPRFYVGFRRPTFPHPDDETFDVIASLLCQGRSSKLFSNLVKEKRMAASVECYSSVPGMRLDNLFSIYAAPLPPYTNRDVQKEILAEIDRMKIQPVSEEELQKIQKQIDASLIWGLKTNMELADWITFFESIAGDWKYLYALQKKIHAIQAQDIQRVLQTYFVPQRQATVYLEQLPNP